MKLDNTTLIIPLHEMNKDTDIVLFNKSLDSVKKQKEYSPKEVLVVYTEKTPIEEIEKTIAEYSDIITIKTLLNDKEKTDFCSQVNFAVNNIDTEWFNVLEFDDVIGDTLFKNFKEYSTYYKDVTCFLPLIAEVEKNDNFINFTNTLALSKGLTDTIGLINNESLMNVITFTLSGAFIKKEAFLEVGGYKSNIKLSFHYELLLRLTNSEYKVYVIPKLGYLHRNGRDGSYLRLLEKEGLTQDELKFWFDTAKKEFFFPIDRKIVYTPLVDAIEVN